MASKFQLASMVEIAASIPNATAAGPFGSNLVSRDYVESGVPVIRGQNLAGRWIGGEFVYVSHVKAATLRTNTARPGDIVFTQRGTLGQVALVPTDPFPQYVISQSQMKLTVDRNKADSGYVYYACTSSDFIGQVHDNSVAAGVPHINLGTLRRLNIPLPPLETQRAIAGTLAALDDRIDLLRQTNTTLEAIAQALFKSWFVDFDPVRAKAEGREPEGMDAATAALFPSEFEESELGLIPKGWRAEPFGSLLSESIGGDWGSETRTPEQTERVAIIRGTDVPDLRCQSTCRVPVRFTTVRKLASRALASGDLVVEVSGGSTDQPTGRSLYVTSQLLSFFDCPVVPASFCRRFSPVNQSVGLLLTHHMDHIYAAGKTWDYQNQSTGIANFQTTHFLATEQVVIPPDPVLDAFIDLARPIVERVQLRKATVLAEVRDTLLPRLISGKLRLAEADAVIEEAIT